MKQIPEGDWKSVNIHKEQLRERFCDGVIQKLHQVFESRQEASHQTYCSMRKLLNLEDETLSFMFDDVKRTTAIMKLALWKKNGFLTDEAFSQYSEETRSKVISLMDL